MMTETIAPEICPAGEGAPDLVPFCQPNLYDELCRPEVLSEAGRFVQDHPSEVTPQGDPADEWGGLADGLMVELERELGARSYRPGPVFRVCVVRRRARNECMRVLRPRDRVVGMALLLTVGPLLTSARSADRATVRGLAAIHTTLRSGCYRVVPPGGDDVLSRETMGEVFRRVTAVVHDEAVRDLIKLLLRAPVADELRLAS